MELARESGAGAKTESGQAAGAGLRGRHRLSCCTWTGQVGDACSDKRLQSGFAITRTFSCWGRPAWARASSLWRWRRKPVATATRLSICGRQPCCVDLALARADGSLRNLLARLSRIDVLVIDDWAMAPLNDTERREIWEICEDRYQTRSTILTSQLPVSRWHEQIGDPTIADGILDRLVHNAHRIEMRGESMRKKRDLPPNEKQE